MKKRGAGLFAYAIFYLAFLYVPVLFLPLFSFNDSVFIAFPLTGFTTKWYGQMLADGAMLHALGNSLEVGAITAVLSTVLGAQHRNQTVVEINTPYSITALPGRRHDVVTKVGRELDNVGNPSVEVDVRPPERNQLADAKARDHQERPN